MESISAVSGVGGVKSAKDSVGDMNHANDIQEAARDLRVGSASRPDTFARLGDMVTQEGKSLSISYEEFKAVANADNSMQVSPGVEGTIQSMQASSAAMAKVADYQGHFFMLHGIVSAATGSLKQLIKGQ